jgi:tetratricopeptide (TPR) repeat protein
MEITMKRVESAIREGRCVLAISGKALSNPDVLGELRRRSVPSVHLGGDAVNPVSPLTLDNLQPVLSKPGGVLILIEPDAATDGRALAELGEFIKTGANKPKIFVASRAFNPFMMPMNIRLLKMEGLKYRAKDFLSALPVLEASPTEGQATPTKKSKKESPFKAPKALFVGREDEVAQLSGMIGESGGPIVVTGPAGIGKRWLIEHVLTQSETKRWPDFTLGAGTGTDCLLARVAVAAKNAGDDSLHQALTSQSNRPTPTALAELVTQSLACEGLTGQTWVIHGLEDSLDKRRGHFKNEGRLEMILTSILLSTPTVRIIFSSTILPCVYHSGGLESLRVVTLGGLRGNVLHDMFEAHHTAEFPREHFGPIGDRTMGHPLASRFFAISCTEEEDIEELLEQKRFLKMDKIDDVGPIKRHIKRRIEKLSTDARHSLSVCALLRDPGTSDELRVLGLNRNARLELLSQGLLEQTPVDGNRRYYVHPLIASYLEYREVYDFENMETLGRHFIEKSREAHAKEDFSNSIALVQEGNRLLVETRRERSRDQLPYPDQDSVLHNIFGLMRRKKARLDIARTRVNESLKIDPTNTEMFLAHAELRVAEKATVEIIIGSYREVQEHCPTPDSFLVEAELHLRARNRGKAVAALERGIATFSQNARMYRRLATIYLDQNKVDEAIVLLKSAMTLEPLMPETYGQLGEAHTRQGPEGWESAIAALNEAVSIDPHNPRNLIRKANLLRDQALAAEEGTEALLAQADETVKLALELDKGNPHAQTLSGALILDLGGDVDQAEWLLKQASKRKETSFGLVQLARVMIRKGTVDEVERILTKTLKKEPSCHAAFAAQAELWESQGQIFHAFEAIKSAKERSPKTSAARIAYEKQGVRLSALIESGAAAEMMKTATAVPSSDETENTESKGERRDPGSTTIRRKKKGETSEVETAETVQAAGETEATAEEAPAEATAEATAEEVPAEATAEEAPAEATAEEAPAEATAEEVPAEATAEEAPAEAPGEE